MFEKLFPAVFDLKTLNGTNGFTIAGLNQGDRFGFSVNSAGDINSDGKGDMVAGAYASYAGQGASYVIFGQSSFPANFDLRELNGINGFSIVGVGALKSLGVSGNTIGDINHDGKDDIAIGAHATNNFQGAVYVIFGQSSFPANFDLRSLNGTNGFGILGISAANALGTSVSSAGDINGDGKNDALLGAEGVNTVVAGVAYVIFGQTQFPAMFDLRTLNGSNGFVIPGLVAGGALGISANSVGDVNGDGKADIALGACGVNAKAGSVYIIFGQSNFPASFNLNSLNGINGFAVPGLKGGDCLSMVKLAGDMNGDGRADIVIGSLCDITVPNGNVAYVIFGQSSFPASFDLRSLNGINGFAIPGVNINDELGVSVGSAGDINRDGKDDVMIGAWGFNNYQGAVYVIFGQSSFSASFDLRSLNGINGFVIPGLNIGDRLGVWSVNTAGDIQGNGNPNIIVGAYGFNNYQGASYVIFGKAIPIPLPAPSPMPNPVPFPKPNPIPFPMPNPTPAIIHYPPVVLNLPPLQRVEVNQPFEFMFKADQIFNSTDGDPLTFSAQSNDGSPLPKWVHFDVQDATYLTFTGRPLTVGDSGLALLAKNPWNQSAQANFSLSAIAAEAPKSIGLAEYIGIGAGVLGFGALIGLYGLYRKLTKSPETKELIEPSEYSVNSDPDKKVSQQPVQNEKSQLLTNDKPEVKFLIK